ncbi:four-carbon acid sugar kinase family protein [Macrococcus capreoli]|uniref:four-carbon acid sugar kinase family protein n=1 Tax=Macrococcus capreoli TaxID=2982690 RepID=UPI003F422615
MIQTFFNKQPDFEFERDLRNLNQKVIVLDDDPTGTQTVKDLYVITSFDEASIRDGFESENNMFYILTNSRALNEEDTVKLHKQLIQTIDKVSKALNKDYLIISRGDSTLRGHSYLEPKTLNEASVTHFDGLFYAPAFFDGNRYTFEGIHYIKEGETFVPAAETEFANDTTFGYDAHTMQEYVEEKSNGEVKKEDVLLFDLHLIRSGDKQAMFDKLDEVVNFKSVIVDALCEADMNNFTAVLLEYLEQTNKKFLFRTAADFVRSICATPGTIIDPSAYEFNDNGGLIVVGSHVKKTTAQLETLLESGIEKIEFDVKEVTNETTLKAYISSLKEQIESHIVSGKDVVIYTTRDVIRTDDKFENLRLSKLISESLVDIVSNLSIQPRFIIAKGGITSSDVATIGLGIKKALVLGQIDKGIPVWLTGQEAKYVGIPYVVFPGNVGEVTTLREVYEKLKK